MEAASIRPEAYRVVVSAKGDGTFVATVPELPDCRAEGASRAEALEAVARVLEEKLQALAEEGVAPPLPLDSQQFTGRIEVEVTPELHRELEWQARLEGTSVDKIVAELLAAGLQRRAIGLAGPGKREGRGRGRRHMSKAEYLSIMEDRASFIEYVRNLEQGGGRGRGRRRK